MSVGMMGDQVGLVWRVKENIFGLVGWGVADGEGRTRGFGDDSELHERKRVISVTTGKIEGIFEPT